MEQAGREAFSSTNQWKPRSTGAAPPFPACIVVP